MNDIERAGGWFSISADEVQDVSNKEQLAMCVRYVFVKGKIFLCIVIITGLIL